MGEMIRLKSTVADGFVFDAYRATPSDARRGGLVLVQEIFGVTAHIRELADSFAAAGFETLAPAFFDRRAPGFEAGYDAAGVAKGRSLSEETPWDEVAGDLQAAVNALAPPVFVTGFCWGGTAAWLAACRCTGVSAASAFYGRRIPELLGETPKAPIIFHFGKTDASIPTEVVEAVAEAVPDAPIHLYDAGHGFMSDRRADYNADAASLARLRTLQLFARNSGERAHEF